MKILDVITAPLIVKVEESIRITFKITGAQPLGFEFPFSNESLTEKKLEFTKEELYGDER